MTQVELIMPKMGESIAEATIIKWLKNEGDKVSLDEAVLEIATDKVDSEVPSVVDGILLKKLFKEGEVVKVGKALALLSTDNDTAIAPKLDTPIINKVAVNEGSVPVNVANFSEKQIPITSYTNKFYSPLVRSIAKQEGVNSTELDAIIGTGKDGRVTKNDILAYIPNKGAQEVSNSAKITQHTSDKQPTPINIQQPEISIGSTDEIVEMDRMRKLIADHMVMSKHVSPHVTSFVETDVTNIVNWRNKVKAGFEKREKEKFTFTPIFIEAIVKAIKDFPMINVSVDGTKIIIRKNINIGMAAALPSGNLIVPVIKNADRLNLLGLTKAVNDFTNRARINKLLPDEIKGGTYTLSNVGTFGNIMGTPIINQPQVAIMAIGLIRKKPVVLETAQGDTIGIRHMMYLSHTYDHRIVDGALGGSFVKRVSDYLEQFDIDQTI